MCMTRVCLPMCGFLYFSYVLTRYCIKTKKSSLLIVKHLEGAGIVSLALL
jgi:hypothetical protein